MKNVQDVGFAPDRAWLFNVQIVKNIISCPKSRKVVIFPQAK